MLLPNPTPLYWAPLRHGRHLELEVQALGELLPWKGDASSKRQKRDVFHKEPSPARANLVITLEPQNQAQVGLDTVNTQCHDHHSPTWARIQSIAGGSGSSTRFDHCVPQGF